MKIALSKVPPAIRGVVHRLRSKGFEAYVVGGAVRDLLKRREPKDWDVTTSATPDEIESLFEKTIPIGKTYGTISVHSGKHFVQVTTYRSDGDYSDFRRPTSVIFVKDLMADLARRDFTMNSMALDPVSGELIDPFGGRKDLNLGRLRTVGDPIARFSEDALRVVRAARFMSQVNVEPASNLTTAAKKLAPRLASLSGERIRDELSKMLLSKRAEHGLRWLDHVGGLKVILPELLEGKGVRQGGWHHYDVFRHTLEAVRIAPIDLTLRLALLLHDIAKPRCRTRDAGGYHFYGHDRMGALMAEEILKRLRFPSSTITDVTLLIRHHLFEAKAAASSDGATRRLMTKMGPERIPLLMAFRRADAIACGPGHRASNDLLVILRRARKILKAKNALKIVDLKIDGRKVMALRRLRPGLMVGWILRELLAEVLVDPSKNDVKVLRERVLTMKLPQLPLSPRRQI